MWEAGDFLGKGDIRESPQRNDLLAKKRKVSHFECCGMTLTTKEEVEEVAPSCCCCHETRTEVGDSWRKVRLKGGWGAFSSAASFSPTSSTTSTTSGPDCCPPCVGDSGEGIVRPAKDEIEGSSNYLNCLINSNIVEKVGDGLLKCSTIQTYDIARLAFVRRRSSC